MIIIMGRCARAGVNRRVRASSNFHKVTKQAFANSWLALLVLIVVPFSERSLAQESKVLTLESRIPLPNVNGRIDHFSVDVKGNRLFVNVPDKKEIEVIDGIKRSVLARWPVSSEDNFPMALDEANQRLFVGVWKPAQLLVFDAETGKQAAAADIAGKTDDLFYDSARHRVYVLTSRQFLEVFEQKDADHYNRIARYPIPLGSQTGLFVSEWGKLFVAVAAQGEQSAEVRVYVAH